MHTINSMCVVMRTETCEHACVRLHIHPNLHTYSVCVCVCVCENKNKTKNNFILNRLRIILKSAPVAISCLVTESKGPMFHITPGFCLTSGVVDYTAVVFSTHLVAMRSLLSKGLYYC